MVNADYLLIAAGIGVASFFYFNQQQGTSRLLVPSTNNNPGNLKYGPNWLGVIGRDNRGFAQFSTIDYGVRAVYVDVSTKVSTGFNTIRKIITRYAPPNENDTEAYIKFVVQVTGEPSSTVIDPEHTVFIAIIAVAILQFESGYKTTPEHILNLRAKF